MIRLRTRPATSLECQDVLIRGYDEYPRGRTGLRSQMPRSPSPDDFRDFVQLASDAIIVRDTAGVITFWNHGAERLYGWSAEEALGRISHQLLETGFPEPLDDIAATLAAHGRWEGALRHRSRSGRPLVVASRWVLRDGDERRVLEINRDETERRTAESSLQDQQRQFRLLTGHLPVMVAHVGRDLRYKYVNRAYAARLGYQPDEVIGRHVLEIIGEAAVRAVMPYMEQVFAGQPVEYELWIPYARLGRRYIRCIYEPERDLDGTIVGYMAAILDETARKSAEDALEVSRRRFDFVADSAEIGVWSCDLPFADLVWNRTCKAHFGLPPDARVTIGTFFERMHPEDVERTRQAIDQAIAEGVQYDVEYRTLQADGTYQWIRALGRADYDLSGMPKRFEGITVNVNRQKLAEAGLLQADRRKDEFLATLAHELRNPLAPLVTGVRLLDVHANDPERVARVRGIMQRQVNHLVKLVDDLLDLSRVTQGKLALRIERTSVQAGVLSAIEACERMVEDAGHRLMLEVPEEPVHVDADPTRLAQLCLNLLSNAVRYTPAGGTIRVSILPADAEVSIVVADSGIGIEPHLADRLFGMFVQGTRARELSPGGLGIGLTLVKQLVDAHKGTIQVASDGPGRGSTFTVTLPIASSGAQASEDAAAVTAPGRRILIVDDNVDGADMLGLLLRAQGHHVRMAYSGREGLEIGDRFLPEVLLLDIGMPGMDGYELARQVRRRPWGERALLVAMTGWGQPDDVMRARDAGIDQHFTKPVEMSRLEALLRDTAQGLPLDTPGAEA